MKRILKTLRFISQHPISGRAPVRGYGRFLRWQIKSRLANEVTVPWIGGTKLRARNGMHGATGNIYCGLAEYVEMGFLLHFLRPDDLFCDIGANIGSYTILASGVIGAETMAFEPDPDAARFLRENIAENNIGHRVSLHEVALGAENGQSFLSVGLGTTNRIVLDGDDNARGVAMRTLDDSLCGRAPVFLKMDVEGFEAQVLSGAVTTLKNPSLAVISTETYNDAVATLLSQHGFDRFYYDPATREVSSNDLGLKSANTLLTRDMMLVESQVNAAAKRDVLGTLI